MNYPDFFVQKRILCVISECNRCPAYLPRCTRWTMGPQWPRPVGQPQLRSRFKDQTQKSSNFRLVVHKINPSLTKQVCNALSENTQSERQSTVQNNVPAGLSFSQFCSFYSSMSFLKTLRRYTRFSRRKELSCICGTPSPLSTTVGITPRRF